MPLPDAVPDRRIYELLKTVDLENLTFSDFQAVAQTIYAEQGAEDELRRIVLVNLARLSVAGEWTGLTSAGGGGGQAYAGPITGGNMDNAQTGGQPFGTGNGVTNTANLSSYSGALLYPFLAATTGDLSEITIEVTTADTTGADAVIGIYEASGGNPSNLLGTATFDASSTGIKIQTSFSSTITLTAGELYFFGIVVSQSGSNGAIRTWSNSHLAYRINATHWSPSTTFTGYSATTSYSLPTTFAGSNGTQTERPVLTML